MTRPPPDRPTLDRLASPDHNGMGLRQSAARGIKWQAIEVAARQAISLAVFTTLARLLDPAAFGLVGLVAVYLAFVSMFVDQGISTALIQRPALDPLHLSSAFWFITACAASLCLLTLLLARPVATFFGNDALAPLLRIGSLGLIINAAASIPAALASRHMKFQWLAARTLAANTAGGAVGIGLALAGLGPWALVGQLLAASLASLLLLLLCSRWLPSFRFSLPHLRQLLPLSSSLFGTSVLWFFSSKSDQIMIGKLLGSEVLGQYSVATRLSELSKTVLYQPLGAVALPTLSRIQHDRPRLRAAVGRMMELNAIVSFPSLLGLSAVATPLVPLAFGHKWLAAAPVLSLLSLTVLVNGLQGVWHYAMLATGHARDFLLVGILHALGVATACAIGVQFGPQGVAALLLLNEVLMNGPRLYTMAKRLGISPRQYYSPCIAPAASGVLMYAMVSVVRSWTADVNAWTSLVVMVAAGAGTYSCALLLLDPGASTRLLQTVRTSLARPPAPAGAGPGLPLESC